MRPAAASRARFSLRIVAIAPLDLGGRLRERQPPRSSPAKRFRRTERRLRRPGLQPVPPAGARRSRRAAPRPRPRVRPSRARPRRASADRARASSSSRLRERSERSSAETRLECDGIDRQHQPVEKPPPLGGGAAEQSVHRRRQPDDRADDRRSRRRNPPAPGRSGTAAAHSARRPAGLDAGAERRKPERAFDLRRHRPGAVALAEATSSRVARRRPRPGVRNEMASIRLVLPAPFGPTSTTGRSPTVRLCGAVAAEIGTG